MGLTSSKRYRFRRTAAVLNKTQTVSFGFKTYYIFFYNLYLREDMAITL